MPSFKLNDYSVFAFDMDHTLVRYRHEAVQYHIFNCLRRFLVEKRGYSQSLMNHEYDPDFATKGVVIDKQLGNFINFAEDKRVVGRIFHGTHELPKSASEVYPDPLHLFDSEASSAAGADRFHTFATYFDIPAAYLCALLIDLHDASAAHGAALQRVKHTEDDLELFVTAPSDNIDDSSEAPASSSAQSAADAASSANGASAAPASSSQQAPTAAPATADDHHSTYSNEWKDIIAGFNFIFSDTAEESWYFKPIFEDVNRFIYPRPEIREWLLRLQHQHGKQAVLVTNSHLDYTNLLLSHALGADWPCLFNLSIVFSQKPKFFSLPSKDRHPFRKTDFATQTELTEEESVADLVEAVLRGPCTAPCATQNGRDKESECTLGCATSRVVARGNWWDVQHVFDCVVRAAAKKSANSSSHNGAAASPATPGGSDLHTAKFLFFGDNLHTDMLAAKTYTQWLPVCILEELCERHPDPPSELSGTDGNGVASVVVTADGVMHESTASGNASAPHPHHAMLQHTAAQRKHYSASDVVVSSRWGSFFHGTHSPAPGNGSTSPPSAKRPHLDDLAESGAAAPASDAVSTSVVPPRPYWPTFVSNHSALTISDVSVLVSSAHRDFLDHPFEFEYGSHNSSYFPARPASLQSR